MQERGVPERDVVETRLARRGASRGRAPASSPARRAASSRRSPARAPWRDRAAPSASGSTSFTSPIASARDASMSRPVKISSRGGPSPIDARQSLQRAHVRDHRDAGLAHRERRIGRREPDVAGGDQVHAGADAGAVHGRDHRLVRVREAAAGVLVAPDVVQQRAGACRRRTLPCPTASRRPPWPARDRRGRCRRRMPCRGRRAR